MSDIVVSVIVPARNEANYIARCLTSIMEGELPPDQIEAIVVDGSSTDQTRAVVQDLQGRWPTIRLIDNPQRITPVALNLGIQAAKGQVICILGAHAYVSPNYFKTAIEKLRTHSVDAVGGTMTTLNENTSKTGRLIQAMLSSRFGVGSSFRTRQAEGPTDTVVFGVYRREVFTKHGLFNEQLVRNQDNEFNSRLRAAGCRLWVTPEIQSFYYSRPTLGKLLKQNFRNGLYGVLTWRITPASFTVRHAIPMGFVLFLLIGALAAWLHPVLAAAYLAAVGLYLVTAAIIAIKTAWQHKLVRALLLPALFLGLHVSYGVGTLSGLFRFGFSRIRRDVPKLPPSAA